MFCQTLSGSTRNWFDSLDPKSVDVFEELSSKFLEEFSQQKRYDKEPTEIHGIKRKPNEWLQEFMDRFKEESAHIKGVPLVLRISSFMHGHGYPELAKKLNDKIPKTVDEIWERGHSSGGRQPWTRPKPSGLLDGKRVLELEILAMDNVNFPPPPPMVGTPEKRNMNKFYDYHHYRGHNTNDCYHLKKQIEEAVASGRLAHLVKDIRQGGQKGKGSAKGKEKVINMVRSQGYRKRPYERVEHWMDNAIALPSVPRYQLMNCPVVVEVMIEGFRRESRIPLVGFSGEVSYPMRVIDLEVTIGECGKTRTLIMEFAVVKSPSPYNALLAQALSRHVRITDPTPMQTSSEVTNPRVLLASVETRPRRPRKEPIQLDDMEEMRQLDKGRKPPKSCVEEKIVNVDIFSWTPADMTGIPKAITKHSIDTYPYIEPKAQKKRSLSPDRRKVVTDEVNEWLKADI
ncbi:reverse transcriptase domain-containing protein, partial [Tanacetum coccineum]